MELKIKRLTETAVIPTKGSGYAAGLDLYADLEGSVIIPPHECVLIGTGLAMEIPMGCAGFIFARSGLASKEGLRPANCVGVADADFRGEIKVALHNDRDEAKIISPGDRIAQLVIMPVPNVEITEVSSLSETLRGEGGFGSTGN